MSLFDKFKEGLNLSSSNLSLGIKNIFSKKNIDQIVLSQFEDLLIRADVGTETAAELKKEFEKLKVDKDLTDSKEIINILAEKIASILIPYEKDLLTLASSKPAIMIVSGVNGVGKTTTIGKLGKFNVLKKIDQTFPNETILVLDATTGQNALNQVEEFTKIHKITGLIITKLDSTAKGGIVLAICRKYKLPILAVGMGEKDTDLYPFKAEYFAKALLQ